MSLKISFVKKIAKSLNGNSALFVDEKFNIKHLKKYISKAEFSYMGDLLKTSDLKKKIIIFEINSKKRFYLFQLKRF